MADVFISYREKSAGELAEQIADALDAAGISCWCARRDMLPGSDFARVVMSQIDECRLFLPILNNNVYPSRHVENEVGLAFSRLNNGEDIRIVPVEIGNFVRKDWVKYYFVHTQSIKVARMDEQYIERLVEKIGKSLGKTPYFSMNFVRYGKCGKNVTYALDGKGVLTLSGSGLMWDYDKNAAFPDEDKNIINTPLWNQKEREKIHRVVVQEGVTSIGQSIFAGCTNLTSVVIPDSVMEIKAGAFSHCDRLSHVEIPCNVTDISDGLFKGCKNLDSVTIPEVATSIGDQTFYGCTNLTHITIPKHVNKIGTGAFLGCSKLDNITIPDGVTNIESGTFWRCKGLKKIRLSNNVISIGAYAFSSCTSLSAIRIPPKVNEIGWCAFSGCKKLGHVILYNNASIGKSAFDGCLFQPPTKKATVSTHSESNFIRPPREESEDDMSDSEDWDDE